VNTLPFPKPFLRPVVGFAAAFVVGMNLTPTAPAADLFSLIPFKRIDASPDHDYPLSEDNGPWLIMCTTFSGEGSRAAAQKLVYELRKEHKLEAYTYARRYSFTGQQRGLGFTKTGKPKTMRYLNPAEYDEIAVLVGDFPSVEDNRLQRALETIKHLHPQALSWGQEAREKQRFSGLRELQRRIVGDPQKQKKGPMGHAFATRNPVLPPANMTGEVDDFVLDMNRDVKYGLLDCPGRFTVRVATFRGDVVIDPKKVAEYERRGGKLSTRLEEAAIKANRLTVALRRRGVEAYEFHDREESVVTVGSFQSVGTRRFDGALQVDPHITAIIQRFGAAEDIQTRTPGNFMLRDNQMAGLKPKSLEGIPFDVQPTVMDVPRKSIAADYAHGRLPY